LLELLEKSFLGEAVKGFSAENHVIDDLHPQKLAHLNEFVGVFYVWVGRLDLPAGVVVTNDHLGGVFQNRDPEHVRWMNGCLGNAAEAYEFEKQQTIIVLHADYP